MDSAPDGGLDSRAKNRQPADPGTGLQDVNADPEPGEKGPPPGAFEYHGWRKLIRNFTPL